MVSGVAVTLGIAVVVGAAVAEATGGGEGVAVVSGAEVEVAGTGVEDGAASVAPHPITATKDRSNSVREKTSPFPLRRKIRMGAKRKLRIHANSTDVAPLPPRSRVSASNDLTSE
ncbi:MAG: hypothetical protein IIC84_00740 [Chloroflexi bacterium]|nr:hypothetical protein [Chloroflexota bacterium]